MNERLIINLIAEELFGIRICESIEDTKLVNFINSEIIYPQYILEKLLIGEPVTVPELRDLLRDKIINFEFIKLDGDVRPAKGTTMFKYIPKENRPSGANPASEKVAAFWDMNKGDWRSVSNRSKEIVLQKDEKTGKPKVVISDKRPDEEPIKSEPQLKTGKTYNFTTNRGISTNVKILDELPDSKYKVYSPEYKVKFAIEGKRLGKEIGAEPEPRPLPEPIQQVVKPSIKPEVPEPIPVKPEEISKLPVDSVPLNLDDASKLADEVKDKEIIAPNIEEPVPLTEPIEPKQEPEQKSLPSKEHIMFNDEYEEEKEKPDFSKTDENKPFEV